MEELGEQGLLNPEPGSPYQSIGNSARFSDEDKNQLSLGPVDSDQSFDSEEAHVPEGDESRFSLLEDTYQAFVHWLAREDEFKKLLIYALSESFHHADRAEFSKKIKDHFYFLLRTSSLPQSSNEVLKRIAMAEAFAEGIDLFTARIWPTVFAGLLLHDIITSQLTWSTQLGGDLVAGQYFWLPIYLVALGVLPGLAYKLISSWRWQWQQNPGIAEEDVVLNIQNPGTAQEDIVLDIDEDKSDNLGDESGLPESEEQRLFLILWSKQLNSGQISEKLENIKAEAETGGWFQRFGALYALSRIYDGFDPKSLTLAGVDPDDQGTAIIQQTAFSALAETNSGFRFLLQRVYATYLLWSLGKRPVAITDLPTHVLFMLPSIYVLSAKANLWEVLIYKIVLFIKYLLQKKNCEAQGKKLVNVPDYGNDECTVCGDNPLVYYGDVFSSQGCLDGLLSVSHTLEEIFQYFDEILSHPDFKQVDLSRQHWTRWSVLDWRALLTNISNVTSHLDTLNLSSSFFNPVFPDDGHITVLSEFLSRVVVRRLDIRHQGMGDRLFAEIMTGLQNNTLEYLDISSNRLTDGAAIKLSQLISGSQTLKTLKSAHNPLSDAGIKHISSALVNSTVTTLDVSNTSFSEPGTESIADIIADPHARLQTVDMSSNDLSQVDVNGLGEAVGKSTSLHALNLGHTNLDDVQADTFMLAARSGKTEKSLDFSDNPLTDQGMFIIINHSINSTITAISFDGNALTDEGIANIADLLNGTALKRMEMARSKSFTVEGVKKILTHLPRSLVGLDISGNDLGDDLADVFVAAFNNSVNCNLNSVHLGNNLLTDKSGTRLVRLFGVHNITDLSLDHNQLTDQTMQALAEVFPGKFVLLDFSHNKIANESGITRLAPKLPGSSLQKFSLADNQLGDNSALFIAQNLVTPIPPIEELGEATLPVAEIRLLRETKPSTKLTNVDLSHNQIYAKGARGLCRVLKNTGIAKNDLSLEGNPVPDLSFHHCQISTANPSKPIQLFSQSEIMLPESHFSSSASPIPSPHFDALDSGKSEKNHSANASVLLGLVSVPGAILALFALYLLYRYLRPRLTSVWENRNTFFSGHINAVSKKSSDDDDDVRHYQEFKSGA